MMAYGWWQWEVVNVLDVGSTKMLEIASDLFFLSFPSTLPIRAAFDSTCKVYSTTMHKRVWYSLQDFASTYDMPAAQVMKPNN